MKKHKKNNGYYRISKKTLGFCILALAVIVVLIALYYSGTFGEITKTEKKDAVPEKEEIPPPEFELMIITADCEECIYATTAAEILKSAPTIKITSEKFIEYESEEGKTMVAKYDLKKLPAFLLKGENLDIDLPPFEKNDDVLVFGQTPSPYYDVATGQIKGIVSVIKIVDPACEKCFDLEKLMNNLKMFGVYVSTEKTTQFDSPEGKALIEEYDIKKIPTVIFSEGAQEYAQINDVWESVGSVEEDGMMILRVVNPPYKDLDTGTIKGIIDATYLVDESCEKCFDVSLFKQMFEQQLGAAFDEEKTVDVSSEEGKKLVEDFDIQFVPTVLLSEDLGDYPTISDTWENVGVIKDGTYVVTKIDTIPGIVYKDLESGDIIGLKEESEEAETEE